MPFRHFAISCFKHARLTSCCFAAEFSCVYMTNFRLRAVSLYLENPSGRTQNKWACERDCERDVRALAAGGGYAATSHITLARSRHSLVLLAQLRLGSSRNASPPRDDPNTLIAAAEETRRISARAEIFLEYLPAARYENDLLRGMT